jgi:nucleoside-diphosphate-sugar epimerase
MKILITGANGYYGKILSKYLSQLGIECFKLDRYIADGIDCDLIDYNKLEKIFQDIKLDVVIHLASDIDFAVSNQDLLYNNNVKSTENILKLCEIKGIDRLIFTSSNSIYLGNKEELLKESNNPIPIDAYGKSKLTSESLILKSSIKNKFIIRCPNIIDAGRIGMLSILFELLENNSTLWVLGDGMIRHQCIYAQDLNEAIYKMLGTDGVYMFNIGSENVPTFIEMYNGLIKIVGSRSKIRSIPSSLAIPILKILYFLGLSPMGQYQFRMLTKNFQFDLGYIKDILGWSPTKTNTEILAIAYEYYLKNNAVEIKSANNSRVKMGILSILKYIKI